MGLAIVAIPEEQDRVWKISSEKVPHLTLLYLGDDYTGLEQIVQFVGHAVQLSEHGPFYLDVERRGELGEKNADVLFFSKRSWNLKWIKQFRGQLLQNDSVRTAFDISDQHSEAPQEWLPHLTLGYPETPAKADPNDEPFGHPIYSVCFDRIAVWDGEFEGPEFQLEWPEREFEGDLAIAYSDEMKKGLQHYAVMDPEGELEHHGVKGMKWGHRLVKDVSNGTKSGVAGVKELGGEVKKISDANFPKAASAAKKGRDAISDLGFKVKANSVVNINRFVTEAGNRTKTQDLPKINKKYEGKAKTSKDPHLPSLSRVPVQQQYRAEVRAAYAKHLNDVANEKVSKTGNYRYEIGPALISGQKTADRWRVKSVKVEHADSPPDEFDVVLMLDDDGFIVDFKHEPVEPEATLKQTAFKGEDFVNFLVHGIPEDGEAFILEHYGVKGMKWGYRKESGGLAGNLAGGTTGGGLSGRATTGGTTIRARSLKANANKHRKKAQSFEKAAAATKRDTMRKRSLEAKAKAHHKKADAFEKAAAAGGKKPEPEAVAPTATSKVPAGTRRKTKIETEGGQNHHAHEDAIKVAESKAKLKKSGPAALSNKELQDLQTRLNLERNVEGLVGNQNRIARGRAFVRRATGNVQEINNTVNTGLQSARLADQLRGNR